MDRLLTRIVLLVITGALTVVQVEPLDVYMTPNSKVCEGDSVTIHCHFQPVGKYKVKWYYSKTFDLDWGRVSNKIPEDPRFNTKHNDSSSLQIQSIKTNESGWYVCKVTIDIPVLNETWGNGTHVVVESKDNLPTMPTMQNTTDNSTTDNLPKNCTNRTTGNVTERHSPSSPDSDQWWIWLALAVGCTVLVVSIVVIFIITRKTEEIIYENTKQHEPSCWSRSRNKMDICDLPPSKKMDTIKPLRKYDTYTGNRNRRP